MTVSTTNNTNNFTGDGATTVFPFTFALQEATDLQVYVGGVLQTLTTNYSVQPTGAAYPCVGGNITMVTAPIALAVGLIVRTVPYTQVTHLPTEGNLPEATLENMFDKAMMGLQQVAKLVSLALGLPITAPSGSSTVLPNLVAGGLLEVNSAGNGLDYVVPTTAGLALICNGVGLSPSYQPITTAAGGNVVGPANSTAGHIATFADASGKILSDGGVPGTVVGPVTPTAGHLAVFADNTGKLLSDGGQVGIQFGYAAITASFAPLVGQAYGVDISGGNITCTLPTAVGKAGNEIVVWIANNNGTTYALTFNTTLAQTISGQASGALTSTVRYDVFRFISDGANWIQQ